MTTTQAATPPARQQLSVQLPTAMIEELDRVCDDRLVGRAIVVERALRRFLDALTPLDPPAVLEVSSDLGQTPDPVTT